MYHIQAPWIITTYHNDVKYKDDKKMYSNWLIDIAENPDKIVSRNEIIEFLENKQTPKRLEKHIPVKKQLNYSHTSKKTVTAKTLEDTVFNLFSRIQFNWYDKQDRIMTDYDITSKFSPSNAVLIIQAFAYMKPGLLIELNKSSILNAFLLTLTEEDVDNFIGHIIAKGHVFYHGVLSDAIFAEYLMDQYQPITTMLKKHVQ